MNPLSARVRFHKLDSKGVADILVYFEVHAFVCTSRSRVLASMRSDTDWMILGVHTGTLVGTLYSDSIIPGVCT